MLEPERRLADLVAAGVQRPFDAVGPQGPGTAHDVEQVPASATVAPLTRVRVRQVAPQQKACDFVVEADAVVADADRRIATESARSPRQSGARGRRLARVLRQDAGERTLRGRQIVGAGWQYSVSGSPTSLSSASVRTPANCAGGRVADAAEGLVVVPKKVVGASVTRSCAARRVSAERRTTHRATSSTRSSRRSWRSWRPLGGGRAACNASDMPISTP